MSLPPGEVVACVECGHVFTEPRDIEPGDEFICVPCATELMGRALNEDDEEIPPGFPRVQAMTVQSETGTEVVYVPLMGEFMPDVDATENESNLASEAVMDIGDALDADLDEYGDTLQGIVEDVILSVRESILHAAKMTLKTDDYEKLARIVRETGESGDET